MMKMRQQQQLVGRGGVVVGMTVGGRGGTAASMARWGLGATPQQQRIAAQPLRMGFFSSSSSAASSSSASSARVWGAGSSSLKGTAASPMRRSPSDLRRYSSAPTSRQQQPPGRAARSSAPSSTSSPGAAAPPASAAFAASGSGTAKRATTSAASSSPQQQQQQQQAAAGDSNNIYEVNEANFMKQVIEASDRQVVILDCYADWCAPCKQLAPLLADAVRKSGGRLVLAKLNVDHNQKLAAQMQVSSLPTVMAVSGRSVVDSFVGMLQPAELNQFIERLIKEYGGAPVLEKVDYKILIDEAEAALTQGKINEAAAKFAKAMEEDKEQSHLAFAGLARCALEENNLQAAQHLVRELKDKFKTKLNDPAVGKAISAVELRSELASKGSTEDMSSQISKWRQNVQNNPNDHQARYDLAQALFSTGQTEEAINEIFDIIKRDKYWNEEAARKLLLKIFSVLGNDNELTIKARKHFASIWFC